MVYKGLYGIGHIATILLSKFLQPINRIRRGLPKNCDDSLHLLDPVIVAATSAPLLPVPGAVTEIQREISQMACLISKIANTIAKVLAQINQEIGELKITDLQKIELLQIICCSSIILVVNNILTCIDLMCQFFFVLLMFKLMLCTRR